MFTRISFSRAKAISAFMSAICSSGVFFSCSLQWRNDPLHKRLMVFPPASLIQRMEIPLSINPRISILSMKFCLLAQEHTWFTDRNSPSDTRADAISIRSTCNSVSSRRAILNFPEVRMRHPKFARRRAGWYPISLYAWNYLL